MVKENNYSKRELDFVFNNIKEHLCNQDIILNDIKEQVKYTNGKVKYLYFIKNAILWTSGVLLTVTPVVILYLTYIKK